VPSITVRHTIPISNQDRSGPLVVFCRWLPEDPSFSLTRTTEFSIVRIWFDRKHIASLKPITDELFNNWLNIGIFKVGVDVELRNLDSDLVSFIRDERDSPKQIHYGLNPEDPNYIHFGNTYRDLGLTVLKETLTAYNRLIKFCRNHKGQYWLPERTFDPDNLSSRNNEFDAQVRSENFDWVRWCPPPNEIRLTLRFTSERNSIKKDDWDDIRKFVDSDSRPNIVLELLANAELLMSEGYRRSALVESVAALETATVNFAKRPQLKDIATEVNKRFDLKLLHSQVKHIGFSASINYLLPILFPTEVLSDDELKKCQKAIEIRNNVVHNNQRDVSEKDLRTLVVTIRCVCEILARYTADV
jgi:hypothetical protein